MFRESADSVCHVCLFAWQAFSNCSWSCWRWPWSLQWSFTSMWNLSVCWNLQKTRETQVKSFHALSARASPMNPQMTRKLLEGPLVWRSKARLTRLNGGRLRVRVSCNCQFVRQIAYWQSVFSLLMHSLVLCSEKGGLIQQDAASSHINRSWKLAPF